MPLPTKWVIGVIAFAAGLSVGVDQVDDAAARGTSALISGRYFLWSDPFAAALRGHFGRTVIAKSHPRFAIDHRTCRVRGSVVIPIDHPAAPKETAELANQMNLADRRRSYFKLASIGGVCVLVHWSFPVGGILVAVVGRVDPKQWVYYCLAYTLLVLAHECGHVLAAVSLRLKLYAVEISGAGGLCRVQRPRNVWQCFLVYVAGLSVQAGLFVATFGYLAAFGTPRNEFGRALVFIFTLVNCWMFLVNLVPGRNFRTGLATDGSVLWSLLLHVCLGRPHPLPPLVAISHDQAPVFPSQTRLVDKPGFRSPGFIQGIEMLNDRTTPMDFVVTCLVNHLGLTEEQALLRMMDIHNTGGALFPLPSTDEAFKAVAAISTEARVAGHSFTCRYASV